MYKLLVVLVAISAANAFNWNSFSMLSNKNVVQQPTQRVLPMNSIFHQNKQPTQQQQQDFLKQQQQLLLQTQKLQEQKLLQQQIDQQNRINGQQFTQQMPVQQKMPVQHQMPQQQMPVQQQIPQQMPVQQQIPQQMPVQKQIPQQMPIQQQIPQQMPVQQTMQQQIPQQKTTFGLADICSNSQPGDLIPHPTDMNQFVICYGFGEFTIMSCPAHLFYNPHLKRCDNTIAPPAGCASSPCLNNGKCIDDMSTLTYRCECPSGFTGRNCQTLDACAAQPCGANTTCLTLAQGSPMSHVCFCNGGRVLAQSCMPNTKSEMNPCMEPNANMKIFPSKLDRSVFIHCEGMRPHMQFCQAPLIFSEELNACAWNL